MSIYAGVMGFALATAFAIELLRRRLGERWINVRIDDTDGSSRIVRINVGRDKAIEDLVQRSKLKHVL